MGCCGQIVHGATGLAKAALGIEATPPDKLTIRARACYGNAPDKPPCVENTGGKFQRCRQCGCLVSAKIRVNSERCPLGKW